MKKGIQKRKILLICIGILTFVLFGLKCLISTNGTTDEIYYVAEAFRFYKGDAMLADDWNTAQMNGLLLLPFVYLYMLVVGTTEGIILYFRILYLIFKVLVTCFCLKKLKNYGVFGMIGVSVYYFFSPQTLEALSYNTIPMGMILMIGTVCLTEERNNVDYYLCGIFLAVAVLSQPFCIFIYFAGMIAVIGKFFTDRTGHRWQPVKKYVLVSAGAFTILVLFIVFALGRTSLKNIMENLPFILQDKNHNITGMREVQTFIWKPVAICRQMMKAYPAITIINILYIIVLLIMKIGFKENKRIIYGGVICLLFSCVMVLSSGRAFIENEFFIPFVWFFLEGLLLVHRNKKKYYRVWGLTVLLVFSVCLATDTGIISTSAAMCPMAAFSIIMLPDVTADEMLKQGSEQRCLLICSMLLAFCVFSMRILCTWTDSLVTGDYSHYIAKGPLRGTFTDENTFYTFSSIMSDLDAVPYTEDDILFCGRNTPLAYLYSGMNCGTMSTYIIEMDYERLEQYYALHPEKFPTVVYYYHWLSSPDPAKDTAKSFLEYIESTYEIYEVSGSLLAISVEEE